MLQLLIAQGIMSHGTAVLSCFRVRTGFLQFRLNYVTSPM